MCEVRAHVEVRATGFLNFVIFVFFGFSRWQLFSTFFFHAANRIAALTDAS